MDAVSVICAVCLSHLTSMHILPGTFCVISEKTPAILYFLKLMLYSAELSARPFLATT